MDNETSNLCVNMDCKRYPPDWDFDENTDENYEEGQWKKCSLCRGYFDDDGCGDILYIQEEPNNQKAECDLCGKTKNIVQMKETGQFLCENACDETYTSCDNCEVEIDCDEQHIFCIYKGEQSNPDEEMTLCESCNHDLKSEFQNDGFRCDDWELENVSSYF